MSTTQGDTVNQPTGPQPPYPPQQPGQTPAWGHPQQPGPYGPPPPKKGMSTGAIVAITLGSVFGGIILIGALAASGDDTTKTSDKAAATSSTPAAKNPASEATTAPAKTAAPKAKPANYPDGDYIIGEDIPAGTYQTPGAEPGVMELCMVSTKPTDKSVMPQLKTGNKDERIIIIITAKDGLLSISGCEPLTRRK